MQTKNQIPFSRKWKTIPMNCVRHSGFHPKARLTWKYENYPKPKTQCEKTLKNSAMKILVTFEKRFLFKNLLWAVQMSKKSGMVKKLTLTGLSSLYFEISFRKPLKLPKNCHKCTFSQCYGVLLHEYACNNLSRHRLVTIKSGRTNNAVKKMLRRAR